MKLGGLDQRCEAGPVDSTVVVAGEQAIFSNSAQSRSHSAHIGQDVVIQYRWHPLYGRSVRRIQGERRASGDFVHVELSPGAVTILPAWKPTPSIAPV